jgi:hypothetical protein
VRAPRAQLRRSLRASDKLSLHSTLLQSEQHAAPALAAPAEQ